MKYCLPIIKESKDEILQMISENPDYDFYEIWLSYIKDLDADFIWNISEEYKGKLIFLFRKQNLEKSGLEKQLKEKIIKLIENSKNFLDLDINDQKDELEFISEACELKLFNKEKLSNKLIISYHDYSETPDVEKIAEDIEKFNPGIIKVATFCKTPEDSIKLLTLLLRLKKENKKFIILGMGKEGLIVRIFGALWGNEMNFAPIDDDSKSAEGQLTKEKLEKILGELNYAGK